MLGALSLSNCASNLFHRSTLSQPLTADNSHLPPDPPLHPPKGDGAAAEAKFVDAIEAWRVSQGLDRIVLCGHSFGGYLATSYCLRYASPVAPSFTHPPPTTFTHFVSGRHSALCAKQALCKAQSVLRTYHVDLQPTCRRLHLAPHSHSYRRIPSCGPPSSAPSKRRGLPSSLTAKHCSKSAESDAEYRPPHSPNYLMPTHLTPRRARHAFAATQRRRRG